MYTKEQVEEKTLKYFNNDELATNTWISKYCLKDKKGNYLELSPDDMHHRLAREFYRIESRYPNGLSYEEIYSQLKNFSKIIPQGSPMYGIGNPVPVSLSNCVVIDSPKDDMSSIIEAAKNIANLSKRRCGIGLDLSELRPEGHPVNNSAGTTSGSWSFADLYSYILNLVGQNGRRGAGMITLDVKHPDAHQFSQMKHDKTKVTGANISLRISNEFMEAVENNRTFIQQWPIDSLSPKVIKEINARELWNTIVTSATRDAEPGLLMWDNILNMLPANMYDYFKTLTVNPCGEINLSAFDSCRLLVINLTGFLHDTEDGYSVFSLKEFCDTVRIAMRLMDDLVDLELEKIQLIIDTVDEKDEKELWTKLYESARRGRRTGLGTTGLADTLAFLGEKYDSDEALITTERIFRNLKEEAYRESINLAKERGAFPEFNWETEKDCKFFESFHPNMIEDLEKYGRRNISILTNAPTGSVSILAQTSSGIEPVFRTSYTRRKKINHDDKTTQPDYIDANGVRWKHFTVYHHNYKKWLETLEALNLKIENPWITSDEIDWKRRIELQATIQQHIDHSISSTINLPRDTLVETVQELYMLGWKKGLKGITVYVDGSRDGVLVTKVENKKPTKRPEELPCIIKRAKVKNQEWIFLIGLYNDKPYEVFGGKAEDLDIENSVTNGIIKKYPFKTRNSRYDFIYSADKKSHSCKDLIKLINNNQYTTITRFTSLSLRHGVPLEFIVDQLQKDKSDTMLDFSPTLARVLKEFIPDGTKRSKECSECGANALIYQEGCLTCSECGYAKCG